MTWYLDAGLAGAAFGAVSGAFVPELIRPLPEPEPDPDEDKLFGEEGPKELYATIAKLPGLRWKAAVSAAIVAGLMAARLDFSWELLGTVGLVPVGVALLVVDARTRYLPTWLIGPMYAVVVAVAAASALVQRDWEPLVSTGVGWLVYGGFYAVMWLLFPAGALGYGDVRLAGLLGLALGLVSWGAVFLGMGAGIALGGFSAVFGLVATRRRHYPYGPSMLLGAVVGAMFGQAFADWYWP